MTRPMLEFVNIPLVNGFSPSHVRRQVRSHAAKAGGGGSSGGGGDDGNLENNNKKHNTPSSSSSSSSSSQHKAAAKRRRRYRHTLNWTFQITTSTKTVEEVETEPDIEPTESTTATSESSQQSRTRRQKGRSTAHHRRWYHPSSQPPPPPPSSSSILSGTAALIPASKSPVFHEPFVPVVLQHYLQHLAVAIPEVDGDGNTALLKSRWFPMVIHSPLLFQVIVLFSASHYAAQREDMTFAPTILLLKQRALAGISAHVVAASSSSSSSSSPEGGGTGTPAAAVRDELIAATAKMASYEAIWGDEHSYHCHMGGVEEMLKVRGGGLESLGLDGFLARLLLFIDTNSAFLLNTYLHLPDSSFPRGEPFVLPNLSRFIGEI